MIDNQRASGGAIERRVRPKSNSTRTGRMARELELAVAGVRRRADEHVSVAGDGE